MHISDANNPPVAKTLLAHATQHGSLFSKQGAGKANAAAAKCFTERRKERESERQRERERYDERTCVGAVAATTSRKGNGGPEGVAGSNIAK